MKANRLRFIDTFIKLLQINSMLRANFAPEPCVRCKSLIMLYYKINILSNNCLQEKFFKKVQI